MSTESNPSQAPSPLPPSPEDSRSDLIDLDYKARRVLVLGTTGTGKSTLVSRFIHLHPARLVLIYDWQEGEYAKRLGVSAAYSRDEVLQQIAAGKKIICYRADIAAKDHEKEEWEWFCTMAFEVSSITPGIKLIVVEELQDLIDGHKMPPSMKTLLSRGRRRRLDSILSASAPNGLHNNSRDQVSELYLFRSIDENALNYPTSMGIDAQEIRDLPDTHFLYRNLRTGRKVNLALWSKKRITQETP